MNLVGLWSGRSDNTAFLLDAKLINGKLNANIQLKNPQLGMAMLKLVDIVIDGDSFTAKLQLLYGNNLLSVYPITVSAKVEGSRMYGSWKSLIGLEGTMELNRV